MKFPLAVTPQWSGTYGEQGVWESRWPPGICQECGSPIDDEDDTKRWCSAGTWHRFGQEGSGKVFISPDGTTSDLINSDHEWREHFDINGFTGYPHRRWVLRARFLRQDGYGGSAEWVRARAAYGD